MTQQLLLKNFLNASGSILDVRSPGEFLQGRIPGSINMPLFTNEERAIVGTIYKKQGQQLAIEQGLKFVGPKLADFTINARAYSVDGNIRVHCWRGGMRSSSMGWLLNTVGLNSMTLVGGYKSFRHSVLSSFCIPLKLKIIGGLTGSGKTSILHSLKELGEQVIDLEALANHRGSSFGMIGMPEQPSTEQFENEIGTQLNSFDLSRFIWIEDESRLIGKCHIPQKLFLQMQNAPLFLIDRPIKERLEILERDYGNVNRQELIAAIQRLGKRFGNVRSEEIINNITDGSLGLAIQNTLKYYDKTYVHHLAKNPNRLIHRLNGEDLSDTLWAKQLQVI